MLGLSYDVLQSAKSQLKLARSLINNGNLEQAIKLLDIARSDITTVQGWCTMLDFERDVRKDMSRTALPAK